MEEYNNEKYSSIESIETLFKKINHFSREYNYCFGCFAPPSALPIIFGLVGALIEVSKSKNITGYFLNKTEKGICLIPLKAGKNNKTFIDYENYIDIKNEDIKSVKIKNEDFVYKKITIILKDKTKYQMMTSKNIKGVERHKINLNNFIKLYQ